MSAAALVSAQAQARAQPEAPAAAVAAPAGPTAGLQPAGRGRLTFWGFQVYDAALWVAPGFRAEEFERHPFVLELTYLRDFSAAEIARVSLDEMRRHGTMDSAQAQRWQGQLAALLPAVQRGDRIAGAYRPGRGAAFFHNGRAIGELDDPAFARLFFAIWLGEATSEPALRQALLGGAAR